MFLPLIKTFLLTRLLRGATFRPLSDNRHFPNFYSHASCEARQYIDHKECRCFQYFYSHASCEARHLPGTSVQKLIGISTHTPLARRDNQAIAFENHMSNFYSHAPCGARRTDDQNDQRCAGFLLTRPMRGATRMRCQHGVVQKISTHTPHAGRDADARGNREQHRRFLLIRLLRGATNSITSDLNGDEISTHTPLARRDAMVRTAATELADFYSHASCEARL